MAASWFASQRWWFGYLIGCYSGIACISRFSWEHRRTPTSHPWEDGHLRRSLSWYGIRKLAEWDTCHSTNRFSFPQAKELGQRWHRTKKNRVIGQLQQRPRSGKDSSLPGSTCRCVAQCPSDFYMWAQNEQWRHKSRSRISTWMSTLRTSLMSLRCSYLVDAYLFIYLFIKNICVCNAQLMQKAQQRRYKTVAAIWTKKFSIPSGNS